MTINPDWLLKHFKQISEAPDAVPRLRRFILDLAVRGKLVEQNPKDEPASELLKRIQAEKAKLIKKGEIRAEKPLPTISDHDVPFNIPSSWVWARIGTCSLLTEYGTSVKSDNSEDGVPVLSMGDIKEGRIILGEHKKVSKSIDDLPRLFLKTFDLLYNRTNSAELVGKTGIFIGDNDTYTFASYLIRIRFVNHLTSPVYSNLTMNAPYFRDTQVFPQLKQQCGQANVNGTKLKNMMIPLAPLAEQHRIVAKVDELMAMCDDLEGVQAKRERRRDRLVAATLHGLNNGDSGSKPGGHPTFEESARFYFNHLPRLTTRLEHIQQLRQTILNLAIRGKLVWQDTKQQALTVESFEVPFCLPVSWRWKTIGDLGKTQTGSTPPTVERQHYDGNIPFIKPAAISNGVISYEGQCLTESGVRESTLVYAGAILMVCIGGSIGKAALVTRPVCFNQQINSISPIEGINAQYLLFAMQSPYFRTCIVNAAAQGTLPIISKGKWERLLIPVPPLAEQNQIVTKMDELMALCGEIEAGFTNTATARHQLLEATLHEVLNNQTEE